MEKSELPRTSAAKYIVRVPERGQVDLTPAIWQILSQSHNFWWLVDNKILQVSFPSKGRIRFHGTRWVGRVVIDGVAIEFCEKVKGAVSELVRYATHDSFRVEALTTEGSDLGPLVVILIREFLAAVKRYASSGLSFDYDMRGAVGSLAGGRIDLKRTLELRAQGMPQLLAYEYPVLTYALPINKVLLAALREVERLARIVGVGSGDLAQARALATFFGDSRDVEVLFRARNQLVSYAQLISDESREPSQRDMLMLAAVILAHQSFEVEHGVTGSVPRTWFLNLETLFEVAVRRILSDGSRVPLGLHEAEELHRRPKVFDNSKSYSANPDLVIGKGTNVYAIGDVKYKTWSGKADQDDVYQLLAHAITYRSKRAFLIFPHESYSKTYLGKTAGDVETWVFTVNVSHLETHLASIHDCLHD